MDARFDFLDDCRFRENQVFGQVRAECFDDALMDDEAHFGGRSEDPAVGNDASLETSECHWHCILQNQHFEVASHIALEEVRGVRTRERL